MQHKLLINRCTDCGTWHHPPRPVCPSCWSAGVVASEVVSGSGAIALAIFLHQGPPAEGVDYSVPYPVVSVDLDDAPEVRFTATVADAAKENIVIGRRVTLDWHERHGSPLPVFRLEGGAA